MLDALGVAVCLADARDPDFPLVYVNRAFEELTGWPASEALGRNCRFLQGRDTEGPALDELRAALAEHRPCRVTLRNHRRSGEAFWNELTITPVQNGNAGTAYFAGVLVDVSEHFGVLDDAVAAERRYRQLVEQIHAVSYIADWTPEAPFRYVSPQIEDLLGFPAGAWVEDPGLWVRQLHPDDRDRVLAEERRTYEEEEIYEGEFRMLAADGSVRWIWERDAIVRDDSGQPAATQGVLVDITELKSAQGALESAQHALRSERARSQTYLDVAGAVLLLLHPDETIGMLNRYGRELIGDDEGDLIGRNWFDEVIPQEDRAKARERFHAALESGTGSGRVEGDLVTRSGERRRIAWQTVVVHDDQGRAVATLSSGQDITERMRAEEEVKRLAFFDPLTGLPNRAQFETALRTGV